MTKWLPIRYRDFYDFPRAFLVESGGAALFFDGRFDDDTDEYSENYEVYRLQVPDEDALAGSWEWLPGSASVHMATIPVGRVTFDDTRRNAISAETLDLLSS